MKTEQEIISETNRFRVGYWNDEKEEFMQINNDNQKEIAKKLSCSPELLEFLRFNFEMLIGNIHEDLHDIWKKLE